MTTEAPAPATPPRTTSIRTGFLVVVSLLWGAGLAGGHLLTRGFDLGPDDWHWFAGARLLVQVLPALLLAGYVLLFVKGPRFMTSRVRVVIALCLVGVGVAFSFAALHALVVGTKQLEGTVEGFDTKTWRDKSGVEHSTTAITVRGADGSDDAVSVAGESLERVQRAGCTLGAHATVAYLPGLEIVFNAQCRRSP